METRPPFPNPAWKEGNRPGLPGRRERTGPEGPLPSRLGQERLWENHCSFPVQEPDESRAHRTCWWVARLAAPMPPPSTPSSQSSLHPREAVSSVLLHTGSSRGATSRGRTGKQRGQSSGSGILIQSLPLTSQHCGLGQVATLSGLLFPHPQNKTSVFSPLRWARRR